MTSDNMIGKLRKFLSAKQGSVHQKEFENEVVVDALEKLKELKLQYQDGKPAVDGKYEKPEVENPMLPQKRELDKAIENLDESMRVPVKLLLNGYSYKEIAKMTKTRVRTVKMNIKTAKNELRNQQNLN